jgi:hypothetical protein
LSSCALSSPADRFSKSRSSALPLSAFILTQAVLVLRDLRDISLAGANLLISATTWLWISKTGWSAARAAGLAFAFREKQRDLLNRLID